MFKVFLIIGVLGIVVSGVFIGAWTNGQQQRANFHSETSDHRSVRTKVATSSGQVGVVCLAIAASIYFL